MLWLRKGNNFYRTSEQLLGKVSELNLKQAVREGEHIMAKVIFHEEGTDKEKEVTIREGHTILRAAKQGRVLLKHKCGGQASCTTCKVIIPDQQHTSPIKDIEKMRLGEENIAKGMRLSCQTKVFGTVRAIIPEDPYKARIRALLAQQKREFE